MLVQLHIENFALIEKLTLAFGPGLNALTGETGAGKSIIIDAVKIVLGGRGSGEFIRAGCERALVEAVFETDGLSELQELLHDFSLEPEEDGTLILSREFTRSGKNTCRLNGRLIPLSSYREIGAVLVDIHGQHDHQSLLQPSRHLNLLDSLGDDRLRIKADEVASLYSAYRNKQKALESIGGDNREQARLADIIKFQLEEIDKADLKLGEEEELIQEKFILQNAGKLAIAAQKAFALMKGGDDEGQAALDLLNRTVGHIRELAALDSSLEPLLEAFEGAVYVLEDKSWDIRTYGEKIEFNPGRLDFIDERLVLLKRLKSKYGDSIEDILAFKKKAEAELADIEGREGRIEILEKEITALKADYAAKAAELTNLRMEVAENFSTAVEGELAGLGMAGTSFNVAFTPLDEPGKAGSDKVEFMFSPNPGEPIKPLAKIASGGEMSRVMLALKTILARVDRIPTMIFDEVDAGIGGQAAQAVAEKLRIISKSSQVLCVTHSAKIASYALNHYFIHKEVLDERTVTRVIALEQDARTRELARMLGGNESEAALQHAMEMLKMANN